MNTRFRTLFAASTATAALVGLAACAPSPGGDDAPISLTIAVDSLYVSDWDPTQGGFGGGNGLITWDAVLDPLTMWDHETQTFEPWLAQEISLSDDRKTMTFQLREDVDFVDGSHMDAAAIEAFYDALLSRAKFPYLGGVTAYEPEFTATDDYTVEMTTVKPIYPGDFWILLSTGTPIVSPAGLADPERAMAEPMGSGPYLLDEVIPEDEARFVRNPDYWNPEAFPFDTLVVKLLPDSTAKLNALISGQIDVAALTLAQVAAAEDGGLTLHEGAGWYFALYAWDPKNSTLPALRDPRVSQAMTMAFDRDGIAETIDGGYGTASSQGFIPSQPAYVDGGDDRYPYDPEAARQLLAEAGYPDGFEVTIPSYPPVAHLQPIIESSLGEIGIEVTFEDFPDYGGYSAAYLAGEFPLILGQMYTVNNLRFFADAYWRAPDPELAALVTTIKEGAPEESAEASQELGDIALDRALFITISRPRSFYGSAPGIAVDVNDATGQPQLVDYQRAD